MTQQAGTSSARKSIGPHTPWPILAVGMLLACSNPGSDVDSSGDPPPASPPPQAPSPSLTFSADPLSVPPGGFSTLTWSTAHADSCHASGAWSGAKPVTDTQGTGMLNNTSTFTLQCAGAGGSVQSSVMVTVQASVSGSAALSWVAPSTNEDGSPLSQLAGFNIYRGASASTLQQVAAVGAGEQTYTINNLPAGTHYFAVTAKGVNGAESVFSNIASKTIP